MRTRISPAREVDGMPHYVVNTGRGRSTHIMKSMTSGVPSFANTVITGYTKSTLCGLTASRYVNVFTPSEASCRECKKRWQLAVAADAAKAATAARAPQRAPSSARKASPLATIAVLLVLVVAAGGIITGIVLAVGKADRDSGQPAKGMLARIPGCAEDYAAGALNIGELGSNEASEARCTLPDGASVTIATWGSTDPAIDDPSGDTASQEQAVYNDAPDIGFVSSGKPDCCIIGNSPTAWVVSISGDDFPNSSIRAADWRTVEQALGGHAVTSVPASWNTQG